MDEVCGVAVEEVSLGNAKVVNDDDILMDGFED